MAKAFSMQFDTARLMAGLDELAKGATTAVRPSAQAGAQVLYDEVVRRVPVSDKPRKLKSGRIIPPGALKASIYQVYSRDNSSDTRATYHVSWNARKAPHGHLVEYGTSRAPAHPFLRPAYDSHVAAALAAAGQRWGKGMRDVIAEVK